jgi:asparagine N-glycosylation enzyme membrane subunit Stt3
MSGSPGTWRRLGQVALAGLLPAAAALPAIRDVVARGLVALGAANSWYPHIVEFRPLLSPGTGPIWAGAFSAVAELGIGPLLMALAVPGLARRWKHGPEERAAVLLLAVLGGALLALALLRLRFELYLSLPLVLLSAFYGNEAATPLSRRIPYLAFGLLSLVLVGKAALHKPVIGSFVGEDLVGALQWLRGQDPAVPGAESVLARWDWGHAIQYYAGKPVLVSPFGTEAGRGAMEDSAAFFFARTPADAEAVLARRRIGFLLLDDPLGGAHQSLGFAPAGTSSAVRATYEWMRGERLEPTEAFWDLVPVALFRFDGVPRTGARALDGYRLLYESPPGNPIKWGPEGQFKIFGVVPGASLAVAPVPPGTPVAVSVQVHTNQGRAFTWTASDRASATGVAVLRLPYATGHNGAVTAGPALVSEPSSRQEVVVPATAVEHGERLEVALPR